MNEKRLTHRLSRRTFLEYSAVTGVGLVTAATLGARHVGAAAPLPADAAPADQQVLKLIGREGHYLDYSKSAQQVQFSTTFLCEPLVRRDDNYEVKPAAAESWDISADNLTWTFHLRQGMTWSDGTPVTADDYVYTVQRMADPATAYDVPFYWASIKGFTDANAGTIPVDQIGIQAVDNRTVAITTTQPTPFLGFLSADIHVVPKHIVETAGDSWSLDPKTRLSCGPYSLESWDKGKQLVYVNNPTYNGPWAASLQKIVYMIGADATQFPAYQNGEIDAMERSYEQIISPADLAVIQGDATLSKDLHEFPQFQTWWLAFGDAKAAPPFQDLNVRKAFAYAIDRDALIGSVLRGQALPAYGLLPPGFHSSNQEHQKAVAYPYDLAQAKALLAQAGFPDGKNFPKYDLFLRDPSPVISTVGQAIQAMLKENLGIEVGIQSLDRTTFTTRNNAHELPFLLIPWGADYYDASNFMNVYLTGGRHAWSNPQYDQVVQEADSLVGDEAKRAQLYQQAEEVLITDVGGIFLWNPISIQLWRPYLTAPGLVQPNKYGILSWQDAEYYSVYLNNTKGG